MVYKHAPGSATGTAGSRTSCRTQTSGQTQGHGKETTSLGTSADPLGGGGIRGWGYRLTFSPSHQRTWIENKQGMIKSFKRRAQVKRRGGGLGDVLEWTEIKLCGLWNWINIPDVWDEASQEVSDQKKASKSSLGHFNKTVGVLPGTGFAHAGV